MTDYQQINFADLKEQYHDHGRAVRATIMLRKARAEGTTTELTYLLRHHNEAPVKKAETYLRDSFDFLLAYYSLLEIACLIRYVPNTFPEAFQDESLWNLSNDAVKRYYEEKYPVILPRLFRSRLEAKLSLYEQADNQATHPLFLRFLGIVNRVREDKEIELFQWFLDAGSAGGYDIDDTLELLQTPEATMKALMKESAKRTIPEQSVNGAQKFLNFCVELDSLLQDTQSFPLFQSAMWSYYSYWFDLISQRVGRRLWQILDSFLKWGPGIDESNLELLKQQVEIEVTNFWTSFDQDASVAKIKKDVAKLCETIDDQDLKPDKKAIREYVTESKIVLKRLLSRSYGQALHECAARYGSPHES